MVLKGNFKSKCACSAGGIGICLCVIFMSLAVVGTTAVGISKNADTGNAADDMSSMSSMKSSSEDTASSNDSSPQNAMVIFFSGFWGQVILLLSFGAMFAGIWLSGSNNRKLVPISIAGAAILYISMYNYYSVALGVIGSIILAFVYASAFSYRVARTVKLG